MVIKFENKVYKLDIKIYYRSLKSNTRFYQKYINYSFKKFKINK